MKCHIHAYGLPDFEPFLFRLRYGYHANQRVSEHGIINLPRVISSKDCFVFEVEDTQEGMKFAVRVKYSGNHDLCLVILNSFVKTVWLNRINDKHCTLNKSFYTKPIRK